MNNENERVYAQIDLGAIHYNVEQMLKNLNPGTLMLAVIKTDGYGHGALPIARMLETCERIAGYAVATAEEAFQLREGGIKKKILVLGYTFPSSYERLIREEISLTVFRTDMARDLSEAAEKAGKDARIHLKLDTGMCRIGLQTDDEGFAEATEILRLPRLYREGIFTHFAKADEAEKGPALKQLDLYQAFVQRLAGAGFTFEYRHCANSAGIIDLPETQFDLVRAGISLYGVYPSQEVNKKAVPLRPALSLKSRVVHVKTVEAGRQVSYGGTFVTKRRTVIATVPVGYGDGYPRQLSNKGFVLIRGRRAPILGRVCMDQFMVDVTDIPGAALWDEVTLIGEDRGQTVTVDELGDLSGRFSYEFLCDLGKRIPRVYTGFPPEEQKR